MRTLTTCLLILAILAITATGENALTATQLTGTIGAESVRLNLSLDGRDITGEALYETGGSVRISGSLNNNQELLLLEFDSANSCTGQIRGKLDGGTVVGTRRSMEDGRSRAVRLSGRIDNWTLRPSEHPVSGQYRSGNQLAERFDAPEGAVLNVEVLDSRRVKIQGVACGIVHLQDSDPPAFREDRAEITGTGVGEVKNGEVHYAEGNCTIDLRLQDDFIEVSDTGCGATNAGFSGTYERTGPAGPLPDQSTSQASRKP